MTKQETHPKKKWIGMAEGALKCCLPFVENPTQSTISPIMNLNSPYKTLIKDTPVKTFGPEIRLKEQSNPISVERVPSNESILFNHSKRSAFQRPVGQKAKGFKNNFKLRPSYMNYYSYNEGMLKPLLHYYVSFDM